MAGTFMRTKIYVLDGALAYRLFKAVGEGRLLYSEAYRI